MKPMSEAPRDGTDILIKHNIHGWIQARYDKGYWVDNPTEDRYYTGTVWVCGDDILQIEVEETPNGDLEPEALGWLELPE